MGQLDDLEMTLPCPKCGRKTKKSIRWIKANNELICNCGVSISLTTEQFRRELAQIERNVSEIQRTIKKIGKRK